MAGRLIWSRTLFKICGKQHRFSPPTSKQAIFRLANRVSDKLAWPRSRALNTGAEAAAAGPELLDEPPIAAEELLAAVEPAEPAPDVVVDGFE